MNQQSTKEKEYDDKFEIFSKWLDTANDVNNSYFELFETGMPILNDHIKGWSDKVTLIVLMEFIVRLSTIKNGLLQLGKEDNYYSMNVLYRSFLEHWLKATYIWTRYSNEKSDETGNEYRSLVRIGEEVQYGISLKRMSEIMDLESKNLNVWQHIIKHLPSLKDTSHQSVKDAVANFDYKNIIRYLSEHKAPGSDFIPALVSDYSRLSSFVHGGPSTIDSYHSETDDHFKQSEGMIRFAINMTAVHTYSVFALTLRENTKNSENMKEVIYKLRKIII
ncbi:MAG: hypothetical protein V4606_02075 [Patescibacteria group bacterium]